METIITCKMCGKVLPPNRKVYCSQKCDSKNQYNKDYANQRKRGWERKINLINLKGGECQRCGYKRSLRALSFHHRDPSKKLFSLDIHQCAGKSWEKLLTEASKCDLLCSNCHMEIEGDLVGTNHWFKLDD